MVNPIDVANREIMNKSLAELEEELDADVIAYCGSLIDSSEELVRIVIEELKKESKKDKIYILLTTGGGGLHPVKRIVNILRNFYSEVNFIVPDHAYSAGTVMCCSGDKIFMSYYSVLGPIDPQVKNKDGNFVAALGYLDKINDLIKKAKAGTLTQAEFIILKDFDLAELRAYEQARDLAIDLLVEWLPKYKFKDWDKHKNGTEVTLDEKKKRAREIAENLSDNKEWKSHGRPINYTELEKLKLKINIIKTDDILYTKIMNYHTTMTDYVRKYGIKLFVHTRRFL